MSPRDAISQLLPCEQATLIVDNVKLTTDVATEVRFSLGTLDARRFLTKPIRIRRGSNMGGLGWTPGRFDCIDWRNLHDTLASKPDMYGVWLSKQMVGTCATRRALARIQGSDDDRCPNCLLGPEQHIHLNQCLDPGRSLVFEKDVEDLHSWMCKTTDAELRYWIRNYLLLRGECLMATLGDMSPAMAEVATAFDVIGWVDILHGRLPIALLRYQTAYCSSVNSRMTGKDWMRQFTSRLSRMLNGHTAISRYTTKHRDIYVRPIKQRFSLRLPGSPTVDQERFQRVAGLY